MTKNVTNQTPLIVGLYEWIGLPDLGVVSLRAKIDTGATTSSLHATDIKVFKRQGVDWVRFTAHIGTLVQRGHPCEAPLVSIKTIKSSNGQTQSRYVIKTRLTLGETNWLVEFTLACRKTMQYRALLGSKALIQGGILVNPALTYVQPKPLFTLSS